MKESRTKQKLHKNRSNHRLLLDSPSNPKDKSILSSHTKKIKSSQKHNLTTNPGGRSVPKIKMKIQKNITNCEESEYEEVGFDEYFIFENRIFPIINSDEKRTINRYFWTSDVYERENKEWKDNSTTCTGFSKKP